MGPFNTCTKAPWPYGDGGDGMGPMGIVEIYEFGGALFGEIWRNQLINHVELVNYIEFVG